VTLEGLGPLRRTEFEGGVILSPAGLEHLARVGNLAVPTPFEVSLRRYESAPIVTMRVEVIDKVPRCTELHFVMEEGGSEIRQRDMRDAESLEDWIGASVAMIAAEYIDTEEQGVSTLEFKVGGPVDRQKMKTIQRSRRGSRRAVTRSELEKVAEVYNAQADHGIEAVMRSFNMSRSTAARRIKAARDLGLIEQRNK